MTVGNPREFPWPPRDDEEGDEDQVFQRHLLGDMEAVAPEGTVHIEDASTCPHGVEAGEFCPVCEETIEYLEDHPYDK